VAGIYVGVAIWLTLSAIMVARKLAISMAAAESNLVSG
jgi:hypothetical protein